MESPANSPSSDTAEADAKPQFGQPDPNRQRPKLRISQSILILREGKAHPLWREAAWQLMENAGKDTQLLLEAQRDLLIQAFNEPKPLSQRIKVWSGILLVTSLSVAALVWFAIQQSCP